MADGDNDVQVIETGDSVKVKQTLDGAALDAVKEMGFEINYQSDNVKLLLMFLACSAAMLAQFYPLPFPENRNLLGVCCGTYFLLSGLLQCVVTFIDKDTIIITKAFKDNDDLKNHLRIRAVFPRFQDRYKVTVEYADKNESCNTMGDMYVGKYFTEAGEFDELGFTIDFKKIVKKFQEKQYKTLTFENKVEKSD